MSDSVCAGNGSHHHHAIVQLDAVMGHQSE
jgi:hypothetical protein